MKRRNTNIILVETDTVLNAKTGKAQEWLEKQQDILLPVPYFLVTFTLPDELRDVARSNQKLVYDVLFRMSAEAMHKLGEDPRFVGGQMGMWGYSTPGGAT